MDLEAGLASGRKSRPRHRSSDDSSGRAEAGHGKTDESPVGLLLREDGELRIVQLCDRTSSVPPR
jgi:hypothetical protein